MTATPTMQARSRATGPAVLTQVFAKAPVPGEVKTRLAVSLGEGGAAELHRRLVRRALSEVASAGLGAIELWTTPGGDASLLAGIDPSHRIAVHMQVDGDLGARMGAALADGLQRARTVLLIGVDVPGLCAGDLLEAREALAAGHGAVLGPAEDGGYWLIGLSRAALDGACATDAIAALFDAVPWSTPEVMQVTRARLRAAGLRWHELPVRWDVDRPDDLRRLAADPHGAGLLTGLVPGT